MFYLVHQYKTDQNEQKLYMSDLEFKPIHKIFRVTISSNKNPINTDTDVISLQVYNNSPYNFTLYKIVLGFCEKNATFCPLQKKAFRINNILKLLELCQSTNLNSEPSNHNINIKVMTRKRTQIISQKPSFLGQQSKSRNLLTNNKSLNKNLNNQQNYY